MMQRYEDIFKCFRFNQGVLVISHSYKHIRFGKAFALKKHPLCKYLVGFAVLLLTEKIILHGYVRQISTQKLPCTESQLYVVVPRFKISTVHHKTLFSETTKKPIGWSWEK